MTITPNTTGSTPTSLARLLATTAWDDNLSPIEVEETITPADEQDGFTSPSDLYRDAEEYAREVAYEAYCERETYLY